MERELTHMGISSTCHRLTDAEYAVAISHLEARRNDALESLSVSQKNEFEQLRSALIKHLMESMPNPAGHTTHRGPATRDSIDRGSEGEADEKHEIAEQRLENPKEELKRYRTSDLEEFAYGTGGTEDDVMGPLRMGLARARYSDHSI